MAVCNSCGHFCPDNEGKRFCESCKASYVSRLEGIEKAARALVLDYEIRLRLDPCFYPLCIELVEALKALELAHGKPPHSKPPTIRPSGEG